MHDLPWLELVCQSLVDVLILVLEETAPGGPPFQNEQLVSSHVELKLSVEGLPSCHWPGSSSYYQLVLLHLTVCSGVT